MIRVLNPSAAFAFLFVLVTGCASTVQPVVDHDPKVDFAPYKSFAFISNHPMIRSETSQPASPFTEERIKNSISKNLEDRGYRSVTGTEVANFTISFTLGSRDKMQSDTYPEPYRAGYGSWRWGGSYYGFAPGYEGQVDASNYTEGALSIDLFDVSERRPIWHGVSTKGITDKSQKDPDSVIDEIVTAILSGFPPNRIAPRKTKRRSTPWRTRY